MRWIDYREKLGVGFSDKEKTKILANKVATFIRNGALNSKYTVDDYYRFCLMTGRLYTEPYPETAGLFDLFTENLSIPQIVSYYVVFVNTQENADKHRKKLLIDVLGNFLEDVNIQYDIISDSDGYFLFPKGAKELDDALVSEPLEWLSAYPKSRIALVKALKEYSAATENNASDIADKFRKTLETFFQEFFGGGRSLEKYISDHTYGQYLDKRGVPVDMRNEFENTVNAYAKFINNNAKHHDKTKLNVLEYLMYQTGNIIRLLITLKREEDDHAH